MQNLPGLGNDLYHKGEKVRNWWAFVGDFDAAMEQGRSLTSSPEIEIDVRPGDDINFVHPRYGMIPVAVLSTSKAAGELRNFDALQVDPDTIRLGSAAAPSGSRNRRIVDIDRDGDVDLWLRFRAMATGIQCGDQRVTLTAQTYAGEPLTGDDDIRTVLCGGKPLQPDGDLSMR